MMSISIIIFALILVLPINLQGIGWQTFGLYRTHVHDYRETLFNPDGFAVEQIGLTNTNYYFSQYLNLNGRLLTFDYQFDLLGTAIYEKDWEKNLDVKQFYVRRDLFQNLDLLVGRSILRWGIGYAFNPTDVVAPQKELSDPDNIEKKVPGNDLIKIEYFGERHSIAFVYFTHLKIDPKWNLKTSNFAFRFYKNIQGFDLTGIALINRDETPIWGGNFSYVIGERLEIHGELTTQKGSYQKYHRAIIEDNIFYSVNPLQLLKEDDGKLYHRYLIGCNYTLLKNILWIAEYYHQDQGYSKQEWKRVIDYVKYMNGQLETSQAEAAAGNLLWTLNLFSPQGAMRDYLMNYINIPLSDRLELKSTILLNLNDRSSVLIPELNIDIKNYFAFYGRSYIFKGGKESEFGEIFQSYSIEGGIRFQR